MKLPKFSTTKRLLQTVFASCILFFASASYANPAGYVEFQDLSKYYGEPKVEINLNETLMAFASAFAKSEDPEIAKVLSNLKRVTVRVYNIGEDQDYAKANEAIEKVSKKIRKESWQAIVKVNEEKERIQIFSKETNGVMDGLVVMVASNKGPSENEIAFINIVGQIDPSQVEMVTEALGGF